MVVCAIFVIQGLQSGFNIGLLKPSVCLLVFLSLIWFGDQVGSFTGYVGRGGNIDVESPGWMVCSLGWILLIGVPLIGSWLS